MSSEIRFTEHFRKEYKKLAKKYVSLKDDVLSLVETLKENPATGVNLDNNEPINVYTKYPQNIGRVGRCLGLFRGCLSMAKYPSFVDVKKV